MGVEQYFWPAIISDIFFFTSKSTDAVYAIDIEIFNQNIK